MKKSAWFVCDLGNSHYLIWWSKSLILFFVTIKLCFWWLPISEFREINLYSDLLIEGVTVGRLIKLIKVWLFRQDHKASEILTWLAKMQQLGCSWGKINEKKLTEKKNFCGQAILSVVSIESMSYFGRSEMFNSKY